MTKINKLIPHENQQWLKVLNVRYVNMVQLLRELNITKDKEASFTFSDDKGTESTVTLTARKFDINDLIAVKDSYTEKPISAQYDEKNPNWKLYWYKYIPEDKIMYFQYNQCIDRDTAKSSGFENYEKLPNFREFTDGLIKELNEKDVEKLVIDLRYNTGGNSTLMDEFAAKLYDVKKLRGEGKVFVLSGRQTFSSGVFACRTLKSSSRAILFGEPTGGNVNGYGDIKMLTLPNSKLQASYSTKYFELDSKYKEGFIPDVTVEQSFENYLKGIDDVYEAVKNYKAE
jgi:C-terminal processing protease CtpA/Prc